MKIYLSNISKRFQRNWIFKDINYTFTAPKAYAILGPNGSGKSTLLRVIACMQVPSQGKVEYSIAKAPITDLNTIYSHIAFCAPGMEIVEDMTLREFLQFHFTFKKPLSGLTIDSIIALTELQHVADKPICDYSSGMKQRVKLAQAIFSDTSVLLLDEPCTNLDQIGIDQYNNWINTYAKNRLLIIASNDPREYECCEEKVVLGAYK
jgi:ABC-type multidrug transport system ATPase subunit